MYLKIIAPCPILNTHDFKKIFNKNKNFPLCDQKGHIRALEFIALQEDVCIEIQRFSDISKVIFPQYSNKPVYLDNRMTEICNKLACKSVLHSKEEIIKELKKCVGLPYIWGSNYYLGVDKFLSYYNPLLQNKKNTWLLKGLDCSGLLYSATNGYTPRNTSALLHFGHGLKNNFSCIYELISAVKPLDLILHEGHVIIILNQNSCIESREKDGVIITNLEKRLLEIEKTRTFSKKISKNYFSNKSYTIRRWV